MNAPKSVVPSVEGLQPEFLDQFFAPEQQRSYIAALLERGGLTRRRAEYFVRLWAYLLLKQQREQGTYREPLTRLYPPDGSVACTHREAAELFYGNKDRGSDRAAGMMIDRLAALGLLEKRFDGQSLCLQICALPELATHDRQPEPITLHPDDFNPRTDAIPLSNLVARTHAELVKDPAAVSHKIAREFRSWARQYPQGMRVLRRSDNLNPVAVCVLYPVAHESESYFFQSPSKSFYLTTDAETDPFKMAGVGDENCTSVYVRAWVIDTPFVNGENLYLLLTDTQKTLSRLQTDFPNLCDIYSLIVHPLYEELRLALGFQKTFQDVQRPYHWIYLALDRFISLDVKQALMTLKMSNSPE